MTFAGTFGPAGQPVPFGIIQNIKGEQASGYDANGNIKFMSASGQEYTPTRIDTLIIKASNGEGQLAGPLGALRGGVFNPFNIDCGTLSTPTVPPDALAHMLPANFGPGAGNWPIIPSGGPFSANRITMEYAVDLDAPGAEGGNATPAGQGSVQTSYIDGSSEGSISIGVRSFHGFALETLWIRISCLHSVQD
jgi:hypothetical protein